MSNEVSRSNQMINKTTIGDKFKTYLTAAYQTVTVFA